MQVGVVVRRAGVDPVTTLAGLVTVALALVLVAAGPIYSDAVTVAALRRALTDAPVRDSSITIEAGIAGEAHATVDALVTTRISRVTSSTGATTSRRIASESYELSAPSDELVDLAVLRAVEGIDARASLVSGAWPSADAEVALDARSAQRLDVAVGDDVDLTRRRDPTAGLRVRVAGLYTVDDPADPFWADDARLLDGVTESTQFRTWTFIAHPEFVLGSTTPRVEVDWFVRPDLGSADVAAARRLRGRSASIGDELTADLAAASSTGAIGAAVGAIEVDTGLPAALADIDRSLTVTRSSVLAVTFQLAILAGYALAFTASLVAENRRGELEVLRARGASPAQLLRRSLGEAAVLTAPAALVAPFLAAFLMDRFDRVGPLARTGLSIEPSPSRAAFVAVAAASLATLVLLTLPTYRLARAAQRAADGRRERARSGVQRTGVDIAVAVIAAIAVWQLATLDDGRTASIRGRFGVDPLLVVAPALGLFGGAFLALRVVPAIARLAERWSGRSASAVAALTGWNLSRRPTRYARAALLLIMAVALGVFATTYEATWERSQRDQATHQTGADVRVQPDRRANDSIDDLHLLGAYRGVEGVTAVVPVTRRPGTLPNSDRPAAFVVLDAVAAADVVRSTPGAEDELATALAVLAAARPAGTGGLPLPGDTVAIEISLRVVDPPPPPAPGEDGEDGDESGDPDAHPIEHQPVAFDAFVVLRDADGLRHRLRVGRVDPDATASGRPVDATIDLAIDPGDGSRLTPSAPFVLQEIELRGAIPVERTRDVLLEVRRVDAVGANGATQPAVPVRWVADQAVVGPFDERSTIETTATDGVAAAEVVTGRSQFGALVTYALRPVGDPAPSSFPVVVSRTWFDANAREIGDTVPLPGLADATARIAGTVEAFPTVDPRSSLVVLADLPTLQAVDADLGRPVDPIDEVWIAVGGDGDGDDAVAVAAQLVRVPYEATVLGGRDELAARLSNDPPAVGTIGVLRLGFLAAATFAVVGFLLAVTVSARDRASEFALLRALGLSSRQLGLWTLLEQGALIVVGLLLGTGIGLALSAAVLPAVSLTAGGDAVYPPVEIVVPWESLLVVHAVVVLGLVAAVVAINLALRRLVVAHQLRAGAT